MELIIAMLIILIAALLQGMTSFGASLIAVPLLLFLYDVSIVVPLSITINLIMNSIIFRKLYKYQDIKTILPMLIFAIIFTVLGMIFLKNVDSNIIKFIIGLILLLLSTIKIFGINLKVKQSLYTLLPVGMISGLLNGIAGLSGPPVLIFLSASGINKNTFRATLTTYFLVLNIFTVGSFIISGNYSIDVFNTLVLLTPALIIGLLSGIYIGNRVNEEVFKKLVLTFLAIMGMYLVYTSLVEII